MDIGVARRVITPENPVFLSGYASRSHESEGVYQDLFATAMMIGDGSTRAVILHTDVLYFDEFLVQATEEGVAAKTALQPSQIMLTATHTHCGPAIRLRDADIWGKVDTSYVRWLVEQLVEVIVAATKNSEPAILRYGTSFCDINVNRRYVTEEGVKFKPNPYGTVDKRVHVLEAINMMGDTKAVLYSYACHPTTMGDYLIGGDYPGFATRYIEEQYPDALALFVLGCTGNLRPNNVDDDGGFRSGPLEVVERFGTDLGMSVCSTINGSSMKEIYGQLTHMARTLQLPLSEHPSVESVKKHLEGDDPFRKLWAERLLAMDPTGVDWPKTMPFHLQHISIGDSLTFLAMSGEICVEIGWHLEHLLTPRPTITISCTNASITYIPSKAIYGEGGYEVDGSYYYDILPAPYAYRCEDVIAESAYTLVPRRSAGDRRTRPRTG